MSANPIIKAVDVKKHYNKGTIRALDGVTAVVDLQAGTAAITMTAEIPDEILTKAVVDAGYEVTSIA